MNKKTLNTSICKSLVTGATILLFFSGCSKSDSSSTTVYGDWMRGSDFEGVARTEAITFTINDIAYVGSGFDGTNRLNDLWSFDVSTGTWTQKADIPGAARSSAASFTAAGKGYVGTGYDGADKLKDFYAYDPNSNTWTKKADFPASARYDASGFAVGDKGYITCGFDGNYLKDLWEYDPSTDEWTQKASLGGTKRSGANVFVIDDKTYVAGGINNGSYPEDFWMYDASTNEWTQKRKIANISTDSYDDAYTDIARNNGTCFTANGKGYLTCGERNGIIGTTWEYNPTDDTWTTKTALEASARTGAVGFTINNVGFITTGNNSSYRFDDLWKFSPDAEKVDNN